LNRNVNKLSLSTARRKLLADRRYFTFQGEIQFYSYTVMTIMELLKHCDSGSFCGCNMSCFYQVLCSLSSNVTDKQTDDMRSQYRDLHYSASRGKNEPTKIRRVELVYCTCLRCQL